MTVAEGPFEFFTVAYLTQIGNYSAGTLGELLNGLEHCSDASIFHHTYQTLGSHHYLTEGFSNDFAQWVLASRAVVVAARSSLTFRCASLRAQRGCPFARRAQEFREPFPHRVTGLFASALLPVIPALPAVGRRKAPFAVRSGRLAAQSSPLALFFSRCSSKTRLLAPHPIPVEVLR